MDISSILFFVFVTAFLVFLTMRALQNKMIPRFGISIAWGICLRVILIIVFAHLIHYDTISYRLVGTATLLGKNIYPGDAYKYHPYLPFLLYIEAFAIYISHFGIYFMVVMKLFFSLFDIVNIFLLYKLTQDKMIAYLYAIHPALMFLSAVHGQIEAVPITFCLLALYFYEKKQEKISGIMLGLGVLIKTWPLLFLIPFLKYMKHTFVYIFLVLLFPCLCIGIYAILFHANIGDILRPTLSYRGAYGAWGLGIVTSYLFQAPERITLLMVKLVTTIVMIALSGYIGMSKRSELRRELFLFMLLFSVIGISGANPLWLFPFVLLMKPPLWKLWIGWLGLYQGVTFFLEIASNYQIPLFFIVYKINICLAFLLWCIQLSMLIRYRTIHEIISKKI